MKKKLIVIKLGGSVITEKSTNSPIFKKTVMKRLCSEILEAHVKADFNLILIHGAGSFGHPTAKKFRLNEGYLNKQTPYGIAITKAEVLRLSLLVIDELIKSGLKTCLVETSSVATTTNKRIEKFNTHPVQSLLDKDIIPLLSGDVVDDAKQGVAILSGDQIATYLGKKLEADMVIFVSDVDGIFDKDPKIHKDAKLIEEINNKNYKDIINNMETHNENDTTGEMKGKIIEIKNSLKNLPVFIMNGFNSRATYKSLIGKNEGTKIFFR